MIRHFCNGCGEETPVTDLVPVEASWAVPETHEITSKQKTTSVLAKSHSAKADLCPPCIDYLKNFFSEEGSMYQLTGTVIEIPKAS